MGRKKIIEEVPEEVLADEPTSSNVLSSVPKTEPSIEEEKVEVPKPNVSITLRARHPQLGGEVTRTFTNKEDANAWKERFHAVEV